MTCELWKDRHPHRRTGLSRDDLKHEKGYYRMNYTPEQERLWQQAIDTLRKDMNNAIFKAWVEPMNLYAVTADEIIATFKDVIILDMFSKRYQTSFESLLRSLFGMRYSLRLLDEKEVERLVQSQNDTMLNPSYTFDNFVTGNSNALAYSVSVAVAESPSDVYNPLFIYGDVGLGKTHLMNAIGNYIHKENPMANIMFVTSERFTNDLVDAIFSRQGTAQPLATSQLRSRMRTVDVLLMDDVQFLSKTERAQEEFFHTFNDLHNAGKQIIISSDRPPKDLPMIMDRLRSRFSWGLTVDIKRPDFETRVAILRKKAETEMIDIPYDCMEYIAGHFDRSIRELEGALTRVSAHSRHLNLPISMELVLSALESITDARDTRDITAPLIIETVAKDFGVTTEDILSKRRDKRIAEPRQIAIYICRTLTSLSTTAIGAEFGGRDHTTVMHSCKKVSDQMETDSSFSRKIEGLIDKVKNA